MNLFENKRIWNMWEHNGWGNSIEWSSFESRRIVGLTTPRPKEFDEIRCKMKSGQIWKFGIKEIKYEFDPHDMWWATVIELGYYEDDSFKNYIEFQSIAK